jgi:hypothetical protein
MLVNALKDADAWCGARRRTRWGGIRPSKT